MCLSYKCQAAQSLNLRISRGAPRRIPDDGIIDNVCHLSNPAYAVAFEKKARKFSIGLIIMISRGRGNNASNFNKTRNLDGNLIKQIPGIYIFWLLPKRGAERSKNGKQRETLIDMDAFPLTPVDFKLIREDSLSHAEGCIIEISRLLFWCVCGIIIGRVFALQKVYELLLNGKFSWRVVCRQFQPKNLLKGLFIKYPETRLQNVAR